MTPKISMINSASEIKPWETRLIAGLLFTAVLFAVLPSGLSWDYLEEDVVQVGGSLAYQLQWGSVFLVSGLVVLHFRVTAWSNLKAMSPFLWMMCIYAALSMLWSPVVSVTLKRSIQLVGLVVFCLAIQSDRRPWTHFVYVMALALTSVELVSAFVSIFIPSLGIDAYFGYAWRGIVANKNTLGGIGALTTLLWAGLGHVSSLRKSVYWSGLLLSLLSVVMSTSSTSLLITVVGLFSFWLLRKQHVGSVLWLPRFLVVMGLIIVVLLHVFFIYEGRLPERYELLEPIANLFGKSADLTGRSDIWAPLFIEIQKHWFLGIGYGAFWLGPGSASQPVIDALPWTPYQGHNGYLDIFNELGVVGLVLFSFILISHILNLIRLTRIDRQAGALFASILVTFLFSNFTESTAFRGIFIEFMLFLLLVISASSILNQPLSQEQVLR